MLLLILLLEEEELLKNTVAVVLHRTTNKRRQTRPKITNDKWLRKFEQQAESHDEEATTGPGAGTSGPSGSLSRGEYM